MHPNHAAFFQFREVLSSLVTLSEAQQLLVLKCALLNALERAHDFQSRSRALEVDLARLKSLGAHSRHELQARFAEMPHRLVDALRGRPSAKADRRRLLRAMRFELLETVVHCQAVDARCRMLLRRMARPHPALVAGGPTEPPHESRVSTR